MSKFRKIILGLCAVTVGLTALSFFAALRSNAAGQAASHAALLSDAFQRARLSVVEEESLERKYRLEPSAEIRDKHAAASARLVDALTEIGRIGGQGDRELASDVLSTHTEYVRAVESLFEAVDAGRTAEARDIDENAVDPTFDKIQSEVHAAAEGHRLEGLAKIGSLRRTEQVVLMVIPIGLVLLALFVGTIMRMHRLLHNHAAEKEHGALHDALTGLANRTLFMDRMEHAIQTADRYSPSFSVLLMDLDRFKEVNDTLGHNAGDELLRAVGARVTSVLRAGDTVARLGGDEFGILLGGANAEAAWALAERLQAALQEPLDLMGRSVAVRGSVGIATYPEHAKTSGGLLQNADVAMYAAKRGNLGSAVYNPSANPNDAAHPQLAEIQAGGY